MLVNTAYAYLTSEADASDRAFIAAGVDFSEPENTTNRQSLDDWLAESFGRDAASERALLSYLKGA